MKARLVSYPGLKNRRIAWYKSCYTNAAGCLQDVRIDNCLLTHLSEQFSVRFTTHSCSSFPHGTLFRKNFLDEWRNTKNASVLLDLYHERHIWCFWIQKIFFESRKSQFVVNKVKYHLVFVLKRSVNNIVSLSTRHQHQYGRQLGTETDFKKMKITIYLLILTAAAMWKLLIHRTKSVMLKLLVWLRDCWLWWSHFTFTSLSSKFTNIRRVIHGTIQTESKPDLSLPIHCQTQFFLKIKPNH